MRSAISPARRSRGADRIHFRPGAVADHLTSTGGVLDRRHADVGARVARAGATASYGNVSEPCNLLEKFPDIAVLMRHYLRGETRARGLLEERRDARSGTVRRRTAGAAVWHRRRPTKARAGCGRAVRPGPKPGGAARRPATDQDRVREPLLRPDQSATSQLLSDLALGARRARPCGARRLFTSALRRSDTRDSRPRSRSPACAVHRVATTRFGRDRLIGRAIDYASFYAVERRCAWCCGSAPATC